MGCCCSSSDTQPDINVSRRRLSIGQLDPKAETGRRSSFTSEDRGLISSLKEQSIIDLLEAQGNLDGRKMSVSSTSDEFKESFRNKSMQELGDKINPGSEGLGYTCRKGLKPESPNQDSWFVFRMEKYSIYAVFDGHGQKGHDVSNFVKEALPKLIVKHAISKTESSLPEMQAMFQEVFHKTQSLITLADKMHKLSARMSGTTATVCIHDTEKGKIWVAHVADSTCVLGKENGQGIQITRDHKPELKEERSRIEKNGGRVVFDGYANHRVYAKNSRYPGLNMSRCLGDLLGHEDCGIICEPEVYERTLEPDDQVLLLCSDGVWEFISPSEAINLVSPYGRKKGMQAAEHLAREAWDRWINEEGGQVVDDITVVLVHLQHAKTQGSVAAKDLIPPPPPLPGSFETGSQKEDDDETGPTTITVTHCGT